MTGNVIGIIGAAVAMLGFLGGAAVYLVDLSVNYGQLQQSVASMSKSIDNLTHQLEDTSANLDGFEQYFLDFLVSRNVPQGPLDPTAYRVDHTHSDP